VLHRKLPDLSRRKVASLETALDDAQVRPDAAEIVRSLIDQVVPRPASDAPGGFAGALCRDIASIVGLCGDGSRKQQPLGASAPGQRPTLRPSQRPSAG